MKLDDREIISRIFHAYGISKNTQLAEIFNIAPNTISSWKKRGIPDEYILKTSIDTGYAIPWLETGEGPMFLDQGKPPPSPANPGVATTPLECRNVDYSTLWMAKEILEQSPLRDKLEEEIKKYYRELTARTKSASNA